jgi:hypothetical protein
MSCVYTPQLSRDRPAYILLVVLFNGVTETTIGKRPSSFGVHPETILRLKISSVDSAVPQAPIDHHINTLADKICIDRGSGYGLKNNVSIECICRRSQHNPSATRVFDQTLFGLIQGIRACFYLGNATYKVCRGTDARIVCSNIEADRASVTNWLSWKSKMRFSEHVGSPSSLHLAELSLHYTQLHDGSDRISTKNSHSEYLKNNLHFWGLIGTALAGFCLIFLVYYRIRLDGWVAYNWWLATFLAVWCYSINS